MSQNYGPPERQTDDELLEGVRFWRAKLQEYIATGEPDYIREGREQVAAFEAEQVAAFEAEAERRGLL